MGRRESGKSHQSSDLLDQLREVRHYNFRPEVDKHCAVIAVQGNLETLALEKATCTCEHLRAAGCHCRRKGTLHLGPALHILHKGMVLAGTELDPHG